MGITEFRANSKPTDAKYIANLTKLADFLDSHVPPPRFHMGSFMSRVNPKYMELEGKTNADLEKMSLNELYSFMYSDIHGDIPSHQNFEPNVVVSEDYNSCGTVACALGHGPLAGISAKGYGSWWSYMRGEFGIDSDSAAWRWLFDSDWSSVDNTPQGAAKRIRIYLEYGVPEEESAYHYQGNLPY